MHFTRESVINDKHLEKYSAYCKVLWMSLFKKIEILIADLYFWYEQSTKAWAIVGTTTILAFAVQFEWEMALKHRNGPFWARIESISSSGERFPKVELRTWQAKSLGLNMWFLFWVNSVTSLTTGGPWCRSRVAVTSKTCPTWTVWI